MISSPGLDVASVAADRAALVRFARSLLVDAAAQADAVQDAWVAALERGAGTSAHRLPWMMVVLRNLAHRARRDLTRRRAREEAYQAVSEAAVPSVEEALHRLETQRRLVEAVQRLDEPFRSTILWVYFEGLSPSVLAIRSGVPAGTVRWRLKTALNRVRRALANHADGDWRSALALFALERPPIAPLWKATLLMKASMKSFVVATSVLAVLFGAAFLARRLGGPARPDPRPLGPMSAPDEREVPRARSATIGGASSVRSTLSWPPPRFVRPGGDVADGATAQQHGDRPPPAVRERRLAARLDQPPDADELLRRARRCELRWDVPGTKSNERFQSQGWATDEDLAGLGLAEGEIEIAKRAIARYKNALAAELRGAIEELEGGLDPSLQGADVDALEARLMGLMGRKPGEMRRARRQLAQELAGLRPPREKAKRPIGERLYLGALTHAGDFERDLAQDVGEHRAAELRTVLSGRQSNVGCP